MKDFEGREQLVNDCRKRLGFEITTADQISWGGNNRLYYLTSSTGKELFAKFYYEDNRKRLYNEFTSFTYLRKQGFNNIPIPYLENEEFNFGVYSYERGYIKRNEELVVQDMDLIVDFLVKIESLNQTQVDVAFDYLPVAHVELGQYFINTKSKLDKFKLFIDSQTPSEQITRFYNENNVYNAITSITEDLAKKYAKNSNSQTLVRLGVTDFGADNVIIKEDGSHCFIDFEDFGWNNPLATVADFINHIKRKSVSEQLKEYFIAQYKIKSTLPRRFKDMLEVFLVLDLLEWLSTFLFWITPEKINIRKFANPNFNETIYVQEKIDAYFVYLERLNKTVAQLI